MIFWKKVHKQINERSRHEEGKLQSTGTPVESPQRLAS